MIIRVLFLLTFVTVNYSCLFSQTDSAYSDEMRSKAIKIYIDCPICDLDYIREQIQYVNYVRIEQEADVYILITSQRTASNGNEYSFFFIGQNKFEGYNDTLKMVTNTSESANDIREKSTQIIMVGLVKYAAKSELMPYLQIKYKQNQKQQKIDDDPWNSWFFRLSSNIYANGEKSYNSISNWSSFNINKITPDWKYEFGFSNDYNTSTYQISDTFSITTSNNYYGFSNLIVKSLGEHWSVGESFSISSSDYRNIKLAFSFKPSIEFNIFPFSESTRRQLRFLYGIGISHFNYNDTTLYLKIRESLFLHSLNCAFEQIEPWGSIYLSAVWKNYLHDFDLNNLNFYSQLSFRIFKGLSFNMSGGISLVHDQINLPKRGASYEEILTRKRQLESQYNYWFSGGVSFSFGSIYNNIVNPRFNL